MTAREATKCLSSEVIMCWKSPEAWHLLVSLGSSRSYLEVLWPYGSFWSCFKDFSAIQIQSLRIKKVQKSMVTAGYLPEHSFRHE